MDTKLDRMDTNTMAEKIGKEVREAMRDRNISQRELSQKTGIPLNTLNARLRENTTRPFNIGELALVLDVLDISLIELAVKAERQTAAA